MKRLIATTTAIDGPGYELVDMTHATVDGDDTAHDVNENDPDSPTEPTTDGINDAGAAASDQAPLGLAGDVICCITHGICVLLLATAVAAAVFGFFYLVLIRSPLAVVDRMVPSECNVTSHSLIWWMTHGDGTSTEYIPGIGVRFEVGGSTIEATAKPRVSDDESWMVAAERDAYFARYPIGTVARCYYSREEHGFVAMSDQSDALSHALTVGLVFTISAFTILLCLCGLGVGAHCLDLVKRHRCSYVQTDVDPMAAHV